MKKKIFFDVDNTICNSTERFVAIYNEVYNQKVNWRDCKKWDFSDICPLLDNSETFFNRPDFYNEKLLYKDETIELIIKHLHNIDKYDIHFVTMGSKHNLYFKKEWLREKFPYISTKNYHLLEKLDMGKSEIDMLGGILIDDNYINLLTSNADLKICMHEETDWNKDVEKSGFKRIYNSLQLYGYLKKLEERGDFD